MLIASAAAAIWHLRLHPRGRRPVWGYVDVGYALQVPWRCVATSGWFPRKRTLRWSSKQSVTLGVPLGFTPVEGKGWKGGGRRRKSAVAQTPGQSLPPHGALCGMVLPIAPRWTPAARPSDAHAGESLGLDQPRKGPPRARQLPAARVMGRGAGRGWCPPMPSSSGLTSLLAREDRVKATVLLKVTKMFYFFFLIRGKIWIWPSLDYISLYTNTVIKT